MGFYAKINQDNIVEDIVYVDSDSDENASTYLEEVVGLEGPWIYARSATNSLNHADIGYVYLPNFNVFIKPKPFESWTVKENRNSLNYFWSAPVDYPNDGADYEWDEDTLSWKQIIAE
jgi:hypothetical protein